MKLEFLKSAVVVTAKDHNPTILHPSFLESQGIVPSGWELSAPPVCTPAFSLVQYVNRVSLNVESNRFIVSDDDSERCDTGTLLAEVATKYVEKLPHVRYNAVGLNFHGFVSLERPEVFIIERFLKEGPWSDPNLRMKAFGARMAFSLDGTTLQFSCDGGTIESDGNVRRVLLVNGNYHTDIQSDDRSDGAIQLIAQYAEKRDHFATIAKTILALSE